MSSISHPYINWPHLKQPGRKRRSKYHSPISGSPFQISYYHSPRSNCKPILQHRPSRPVSPCGAALAADRN
nr:MAG TPA: hypothetical protein [Caudoviricetes sp.]